uniref:Uncharacterized protein n=1 Tax=Arundo donax TaxID=35708 RepID=A0A0A9APY0_ARUDO
MFLFTAPVTPKSAQIQWHPPVGKHNSTMFITQCSCATRLCYL